MISFIAAINEEGQGVYSRPCEPVPIKDPYDVPTQPRPIDINELINTSCVLTLIIKNIVFSKSTSCFPCLFQ
ncbi:unnamed protein product [Adineta steineri]|uniref:Uncharacterized protein n=1 Tax=Adineta steineri TaxID=433720 RepID=A0A813ZPN2_9BILA|nr:unnamed protein product [Adineta steineri]CAF1210006.1 unnamed protein product [Adineta steineri]